MTLALPRPSDRDKKILPHLEPADETLPHWLFASRAPRVFTGICAEGTEPSEGRQNCGSGSIGGAQINPAPLDTAELFDLWHARDRLHPPSGGTISAVPDLGDAVAAAMMPSEADALCLLVSPAGRILAATSEAMSRIHGLLDSALDRLPFDAGDTAKIHLGLYHALRATDGKGVTLRVRNLRTGYTMLIRLTGLTGPEPHTKLARIDGVDAYWPDELSERLRLSFEFDIRQIALLRAIATGETIEELALHLGQSAEATGAELAAILRRSATRSTEELLQLIFGMLATTPAVADANGALRPLPSVKDWGLGINPYQPQDSHLLKHEARQIEWLEYGAPSGRPVLYMHSCYGLTRWSARAIRAARQRGLRIVVPLRAGYGRSSPLSAGLPWRCGVLADYARLCDHLGLSGLQVVTQGSDLRFALALAQMRPDLVTSVLACAAQLPLSTPAQYERLGKWQRFVLRNARYAPEVLPSVARSAYAMLHSLGIEDMLRLLNASSPPDIAALDSPEIREALVTGMSHALSSDPERGPTIFAAECLDAEQDWSALLLQARVPVRLMQGDQDPLSPLATLTELRADFPRLEVQILEGTGQFVLHQRWPEVLDAIEERWRATR